MSANAVGPACPNLPGGLCGRDRAGPCRRRTALGGKEPGEPVVSPTVFADAVSDPHSGTRADPTGTTFDGRIDVALALVLCRQLGGAVLIHDTK
jgi:hypothetical protein